jgi:hypothetical protein
MIYKQVRSNDKSDHTNLQVTNGKEGGKPVFGPFVLPANEALMKKGDKLHVTNGTVLALEDKPVTGADKLEYFRVLRVVEVPPASYGNQKAWKLQDNLPQYWPDPCYVKGIDMTTEFYFGPG